MWGGGVCVLGFLCGVSGVCGCRVFIVIFELILECWFWLGVFFGIVVGVVLLFCMFGLKVNLVWGLV